MKAIVAAGRDGPVRCDADRTLADELTVFVVPLVRGEALAACVAAIRSQGLEPIILDSPIADGVRDVQAPMVHTADRSVPRRRAHGLRHAATPFVAFVEDTFIVDAGWCRSVRDALVQPGVGAAGGPVVVDPTLGPAFRALGLCEYGAFADAEGTRSDRISCGAFAVRRDLLIELANSDLGLVDGDIFAAIAAARCSTVFDRAAVARYAAEHADGARLLTRARHGRLYGRMFSRGKRFPGRVLHGLTAILVPPLLFARTVRTAPAWAWKSPRTLAWVLGMNLAWGLGEALGKLTGDAGDSLSSWE